MRPRSNVCGVVGLCILSTGAQAQTLDSSAEADREADMFGQDHRAQGNREETLFGVSADQRSSSNVADVFAAKMAEADDILDLGGELYTRFQLALRAKDKPKDYELVSPNLLHLYLDGQPNDRVRGFVRTRLAYDYTVEEGDTDAFGRKRQASAFYIDQLWLKFDVDRLIYVTLGRQPVRWGSGRYWNPTDFLNKQHRDPLAIFDERLGVNLLKLHVPVESLGWNLYSVLNLDGASSIDELGGAIRAEFLLWENELAFSSAFRRDTPVRFGVDISSGVGAVDGHVEMALYRGEDTFYRGSLVPSSFIFPSEYSREDEWIAQLAAGAEVSLLYSDQDSAVIGVECFLNDAGYADAELYSWLAANNAMVPFYLGRQYVAGYLMLAQPGSWNDTTFILSAIGNISDQTAVVRFDYQVLLLTYLELSLFASAYLGDQGEFHYRTEIAAIPGNPRYDNGLEVEPQDYLFGLWLALKL